MWIFFGDLLLGGSDLEIFCEFNENSQNFLWMLRQFFGTSQAILLEFFGNFIGILCGCMFGGFWMCGCWFWVIWLNQRLDEQQGKKITITRRSQAKMLNTSKPLGTIFIFQTTQFFNYGPIFSSEKTLIFTYKSCLFHNFWPLFCCFLTRSQTRKLTTSKPLGLARRTKVI